MERIPKAGEPVYTQNDSFTGWEPIGVVNKVRPPDGKKTWSFTMLPVSNYDELRLWEDKDRRVWSGEQDNDLVMDRGL